MMPTFWEIDQQLYEHERPAYRYWAQGSGSDPTENPEWVAERERLTVEWHRLCPWPVPKTKAMKLWDGFNVAPSYQAVLVHYARDRACYIYTLRPRRWRWLARWLLKCQLVLVDSNAEACIVTPERAKEKCRDFRNWMGENRVGG